MRVRIREVQAQSSAGEDEKASYATVFHDLLNADLPPSEKTVDRLCQEAGVFVFAGTETTAWTLSVITYHLLSKPQYLKALRSELEQAMPDEQVLLPWKELERLPYLVRGL